MLATPLRLSEPPGSATACIPRQPLALPLRLLLTHFFFPSFAACLRAMQQVRDCDGRAVQPNQAGRQERLAPRVHVSTVLACCPSHLRLCASASRSLSMRGTYAWLAANVLPALVRLVEAQYESRAVHSHLHSHAYGMVVIISIHRLPLTLAARLSSLAFLCA